MADQSKVTPFVCTRCGKDFRPPQWTCDDGYRHTVELKTYYVRTQGLSVHYGPVRGNQVQSKHRGVLTFVRGMYQTADPEQQEFLDQYKGCISAEEWRDINLDPKERDVMKKKHAERLEKENNDLLSKIKALEEEKAALAAQANSGAQGKGSEEKKGK
jgi:hypothetical protein